VIGANQWLADTFTWRPDRHRYAPSWIKQAISSSDTSSDHAPEAPLQLASIVSITQRREIHSDDDEGRSNSKNRAATSFDGDGLTDLCSRASGAQTCAIPSSISRAAAACVLALAPLPCASPLRISVSRSHHEPPPLKDLDLWWRCRCRCRCCTSPVSNWSQVVVACCAIVSLSSKIVVFARSRHHCTARAHNREHTTTRLDTESVGPLWSTSRAMDPRTLASHELEWLSESSQTH